MKELDRNISRKLVDEYLTRLTIVNETQAVIAEENIVNDKGVLVVKKGASIDSSARAKIVESEISNIEYSISISDDIGAAELFLLLQKYLKKRPQYQHIQTLLNLDSHLQFLCGYYSQFPILRQKITVLARLMPSVFEKSIGTAWLAMLISHQKQLTEQEIQSAFLAGLCMDIGFLHLPSECAMDTARWAQSHTIIGWKILKEIDLLNGDIAIAVLEHHERCDGTGYPRSSFKDNLGLLGQIVAMSCLIVEHPSNKNSNGCLYDLIPTLQINALVHRYDVYEAIITLIRKSAQEAASCLSRENIEDYINGLLEKSSQLASWVDTIDGMITSFTGNTRDKTYRAIKQTYIYLLRTIHGAGLLNKESDQWLINVKEKKLECDFKEVENFSSFIEELHQQLSFITSQFETLLAESSSEPGEQTLPHEKALILGLAKIESFR